MTFAVCARSVEIDFVVDSSTTRVAFCDSLEETSSHSNENAYICLVVDSRLFKSAWNFLLFVKVVHFL